LHARDLADLDAGDVDRLALARRDRLGGRHLGLDLVKSLPTTAPSRAAQPLAGEDHRATTSRDDDQPDDRQRSRAVLADRASLAAASCVAERAELRAHGVARASRL
jgi:hypothetical protein